MPETQPVNELLETATEAARLAGKLIKENFGSDLTVNEMQRHDIKLEMDVRSQELIVKFILDRHPDHLILGEEGNANVGGEGDVEWIVDPIDGTVNYFFSIPHFCVSIAARRKNTDHLLVGVIYLITRVFDLLLRRNDVYDEYAFPAAPRTLDGLDKANTASNKSIIQVDGLPTLCVGSYCCTEGTEWVDDKGCVVSASAPKPVPALNGQELTSKLAKA
jgi:hypothetical protein